MVSSVESQTHWSAVMSIGLLYNLVRLLVVRQIDCEEGHAEIGESFVKIAVLTEYMVVYQLRREPTITGAWPASRRAVLATQLPYAG